VGSIVLLGYGRFRLKVAKAGSARVAFPIVNGEREGGLWYDRMACSLVTLGSLVRGSRGHSGAVRCSAFLVEEER
jgi:hypothetical protein